MQIWRFLISDYSLLNPPSPENHVHTHIISTPNLKIAILLWKDGICIVNKNIALLIQQILNKNNKKTKVILKTALTTSFTVKNQVVIYVQKIMILLVNDI